MFKLFIENKLISTNKLRFKTRNSSINQLLAITHEIYKSFDEGIKLRDVFLNILKMFDKVRHEGHIFKFKENGISAN